MAKPLSPQDFYIYGLDTEENDTESPYYDERIGYALDPNKIKNVLALGVHVPILVKKARKGEISDVPAGSKIVNFADALILLRDEILCQSGALSLL